MTDRKTHVAPDPAAARFIETEARRLIKLLDRVAIGVLWSLDQYFRQAATLAQRAARARRSAASGIPTAALGS